MVEDAKKPWRENPQFETGKKLKREREREKEKKTKGNHKKSSNLLPFITPTAKLPSGNPSSGPQAALASY